VCGGEKCIERRATNTAEKALRKVERQTLPGIGGKQRVRAVGR